MYIYIYIYIYVCVCVCVCVCVGVLVYQLSKKRVKVFSAIPETLYVQTLLFLFNLVWQFMSWKRSN